MSAQNHPPDKATPQTWPEWGVDTAVGTGGYETKNTLRTWVAQLVKRALKTVVVRVFGWGLLPLRFGDWLVRRLGLGAA